MGAPSTGRDPLRSFGSEPSLSAWQLPNVKMPLKQVTRSIPSPWAEARDRLFPSVNGLREPMVPGCCVRKQEKAPVQRYPRQHSARPKGQSSIPEQVLDSAFYCCDPFPTLLKRKQYLWVTTGSLGRFLPLIQQRACNKWKTKKGFGLQQKVTLAQASQNRKKMGKTFWPLLSRPQACFLKGIPFYLTFSVFP